MNTTDILRLVHPAIAVFYVFPLIGIATYFALQTRQRRLAAVNKVKTKIPPVVGQEHVKVGRWLAASVVGIALLGMAHPIIKTLIRTNALAENPFQVIFIAAMYVFTIAALVLLYRAQTPTWRGSFATLSSMGLIVLGCQDGIFRRTNEWYISHYYYGIVAALLMIISVAILPEIYRSKAWRRSHIALNAIALLLFVGIGVTGPRDLLEIPLSWQEPAVYQCDFANQTCE
jgi:membrane protein YdbS with pleckstrin-like domain